jgi:hypothetical protein
MSDTPPQDLVGLLYSLDYIDDPKSYVGLSEADRTDLERKYTPSQILDFFDALTWAIEHPDFPFLTLSSTMLPDMKHDNPTIVGYFTKLREGMRPVAERLRSTTTPR